MFPASYIAVYRDWCSTNLLQPLPGAFHPARRRNCTLRNLSVHLYSNRSVRINSQHDGVRVRSSRTSMCQPYRLDYMHIALSQSLVSQYREFAEIVRKPSCYFLCFNKRKSLCRQTTSIAYSSVADQASQLP